MTTRVLTICAFLSAAGSVFAQQPSIHQQESEFYRAHPELVGKTVVPPALSKRSDLEKPATLSSIVYGFHPYWQNGSESNYYFSLLTHIVYFSAEIDSNTGNFTTTNLWSSAAVVSTAKTYGKKVHLCITLFAGHATLLTNATAKANLIANCLAQLNVRNADGINVDFESVGSGSKTDFRNFMVQLGDSLKAHGKELTIELPAVDWNGIFDTTFFSTTSAVTDLYFLMAYDYYWTGSPTAGPVAPLTSGTLIYHCMRSVDTYLSRGCPSGKLIAGFPYYGYDWPVTSSSRMSARTGSGTSRTYTTIVNNYIDTIAAGNQFFDATYNVPWYRYQSGGNWRQCWYDDSLSLAKKYDSVKTRNIAGVGMWALGYDGTLTALWGAIQNAFGSTPLPDMTVFDDFEGGVGHFSTSLTYSGSTIGISGLSTQTLTTAESKNGTKSLQIILKDKTDTTANWTVRVLSGIGSRSNNIQFSNAGYIGFWMKTSTAPTGAQVALLIDDQRNGSVDKTERSSKQTVVNDGQWHVYQWQLPGSGWASFSGGNGVLDSTVLSLDAIMLYAPNASPDWTLYIDDVSKNNTGYLPVELVAFNASVSGTSVRLHWNTITETANHGFDVQRMQDGQVWKSLAFLPGFGTSTIEHSYEYVDHPAEGTFHYRLQQIDNNGSFTYSNEIAVSVGKIPVSCALEQNFPNPFNPSTTISFTLPVHQQIRLTVYDVLGREVVCLADGLLDAGVHSATFSPGKYGLSSGTYVYRLQGMGTVLVRKMVYVK
jgi:spore germination protein YaaH